MYTGAIGNYSDMKHTDTKQEQHSYIKSPWMHGIVAVGVGVVTVVAIGYFDFFAVEYHADAEVTHLLGITGDQKKEKKKEETAQVLDKEAYDLKMIQLALGVQELPTITTVATSSDGILATTTTKVTSTSDGLWPVTDAPYPKAGALLPFNRIIAYYGNFYSTRMGALGEYPADEMIARLEAEVSRWEKADPYTPVVPAIHYIAATAQPHPGEDGGYRFRMPDDQIQHAVDLAERIDGIVFLDLQIGQSDIMREVKAIEEWLRLPNVHLGIDPEFSMKRGGAPGTEIGTVSAADVNAVAEYLAQLVEEHDLPPKVLVIHRFTYAMVSNTQDIKPLPEVQIVMHMDGWGEPAKKFGTYNQVVYPEPVQFTGFKLFYKNDLKPPSTHVLTPEELLTLKPQPIYIQYQ